MKKITSLLFLFSLLTFSTFAQWSNDPLVNSIVNNLGGSQAVPHIAYDANGNFYIGFYSNNAGNYDVRLQYFTFDGVAQWATDGLLVSNHPQNSWVTDWDLTTDNTGNCVLAFNDNRNGNLDIFAYAISPAGAFLWGADGITLTTDPEFEAVPSITVTSANNVIVAWSRPTATQAEMVMQKITPSGTLSWGSAGITYQSGSYSYSGPRVMGVENDQYLMVFYKETGNFPALTRHIYTQKFDASGIPVWTSDVLVSNSNGISAFTNYPTIASDNANGVIVAWTDDRNSDNNINAAVNRILSDGTSSWPANGTLVANISSNSDQNPQILGVNSANEVLITWSKKNGNQSQTAIAGQKFSSTGVPLWTNAGLEFIPMSSDVAGTVGGAVFNGTDAMIVYEYGTFIDALAVDNSGNMIWTPTNTLMAGRSTSKVHNIITGLYNGQMIATWEEDGNDIYMQNIYTDGSIGDPPISTDATLSDLTVNGTTVAGFSPSTFSYNVPIPTGDPLPVTGATSSFPAATVDITQAVAVPGIATVLVTAEDGVTQLTYTVNFYVAGTDATLTDLTVDGVTIPGFDPNVFSYDYTVPTGDPIPVVGATPADPNAEVEINQAPALPGIATVLVTSEDGLTTNTYTVNYLYTPGADATLADLQVGGVTIQGFDPLVLEYSYVMIYNEPAPYVLGIPNDPLATVDDTQCLSVPGDAVLVVTAEDGITVLTYTVHFYYLGYNATLSDLTVDGVTIPGFDPNITIYEYVVDNVSIIPVVDGITADPLATLTVTQAPAIPGIATLHVVAEDGVNELTYTVSFLVVGTDANLTDLTTDGVTVTDFDPLVVYYEVDVYEGEPIPVVDGTTSDPLATMVVTQASAVPGEGTVLVTAQDGTTQKTYTIHFNLITGISDEAEAQISIYPNPVAEKLMISGLTGTAHLRIVNLVGEKVFDGEVADHQEIILNSLKEGLYFGMIQQQNGTNTTVKFIKK
ncbi:MAG: T9SS type A sorting domain-containing protein [Bacteroidales bacterium]|nr:T9SS type A sorting domain-containing protein [Bacteroidales bacterium]